MKLTELIGLLGFLLAITTFIITRFERRKNLIIHLKFEYIEKIEKNFLENEKNSDEIRVVTVEITNDSNRIILVNIDSLEIKCNNIVIKNFNDVIGRENFKNPMNPGDINQLGIFLDDIVGCANIKSRDSGEYPISAIILDLSGKTYKTQKKYSLLLDVDDIIFRKVKCIFSRIGSR